MHRTGIASLAGAALLASVAAAPSPAPGPTVPDLSHGDTDSPVALIVAGRSGSPVAMTAADLARLPVSQVTVSFETEHGSRQGTFEGPLLWTVLDHAHAIDPAKPRDQVRQMVVATGRDGYTAAIALGEIAPGFEGKPVILAERSDGRSLGPQHARIVVPGDRRGGRDVRDVVSLVVMAPSGGR